MASPRDQAVLQAIFNPNNPFGDDLCLEGEGELTDDESGDIDAAMEAFDQAIAIIPERASAYNNRAQALRLKGDNTGALSDLNKAVELSEGKGRTACQALVQRGLLYRLNQQDPEALHDFQQAAGLGNKFARKQVTLMNPYAALCNRMLAEMMTNVIKPEPPSV
ncbi:tetratricopeptide repeat protein 36 isoform X2 [Narcine bancroftii]|uniref:tetratricopeptide repeat protein 36 isoform X2 n=1 Tax=Narcine bancroftii TaxID=1343680 RepID=UPI0038317ADA